MSGEFSENTGTAEHPVRVLIVSPEAVFRAGLVHIVEHDPRLCVCAEVNRAAGAWDACGHLEPEVAAVDIGADGSRTSELRDLLRLSPTLRLVAFAGMQDALCAQRAMAAGALGYLTRSDPVSDIVMALLYAAAGRRHVGSAMRLLLLDGLAQGQVRMSGRPEAALSDRELEVYRLIGHGRKTCEIATELGVSVKTVETHKQRIKEKLHLPSGTALQQHATLARERRTRPGH